MNTKLGLGIIGMCVLLGVVWWYGTIPDIEESQPQPQPEVVAERYAMDFFECEFGKTIDATFDRESNTVELLLSDGRVFTLPQVIAASGAKYANENDTFVFWTKGETAFITEGENSQQTFSNCVTLGQVQVETEGRIILINRDQVVFDGPSLITILTSEDEEKVIAVPSMGIGLCAARLSLADTSILEIGDRIRVRGNELANNHIVPCQAESHYLEVL